MRCAKNATDEFQDSTCNTLMGSFNVTYIPEETRRKRRLNEESITGDITSRLEQIIAKHSGSVSDVVPGIDGIAVKNMAVDLETFVETTPNVSGANTADVGASKGLSTGAIVPIVLFSIIAFLALVAYTNHRRRQHAIIVELEEGEGRYEEDNEQLRSPKEVRPRSLRTQVVETEEMYPVSSPVENSSIFDCICSS